MTVLPGSYRLQTRFQNINQARRGTRRRVVDGVGRADRAGARPAALEPEDRQR